MATTMAAAAVAIEMLNRIVWIYALNNQRYTPYFQAIIIVIHLSGAHLHSAGRFSYKNFIFFVASGGFSTVLYFSFLFTATIDTAVSEKNAKLFIQIDSAFRKMRSEQS